MAITTSKPKDEDMSNNFKHLLAMIFMLELLGDASYSILATYLPWLSETHGIEEKYLGLMF